MEAERRPPELEVSNMSPSVPMFAGRACTRKHQSFLSCRNGNLLMAVASPPRKTGVETCPNVSQCVPTCPCMSQCVPIAATFSGSCQPHRMNFLCVRSWECSDSTEQRSWVPFCVILEVQLQYRPEKSGPRLGHVGTRWDTLGHSGTRWDTSVSKLCATVSQRVPMCPNVSQRVPMCPNQVPQPSSRHCFISKIFGKCHECKHATKHVGTRWDVFQPVPNYSSVSQCVPTFSRSRVARFFVVCESTYMHQHMAQSSIGTRRDTAGHVVSQCVLNPHPLSDFFL